MSLNVMRLDRPEHKAYAQPQTGSIQFKPGKTHLAQNKFYSQPSENPSIATFHKAHFSTNPFRLLKGLAKWLLATLKQECNAGIPDETADLIATELLKKCSQDGEALFLNFQGGAHAAMIVKTSGGYAFLSFGNGSERCSDVKAENVRLSAREEKANETRVKSKLKTEIKKYRDRTIQQENHIKISQAQTGTMISKFNEIKSKGYRVFGQNCAHTAMQVLEAGKHSRLQLSKCTVTANMCFPTDAMAYAKQMSKETEKLLPKLKNEKAQVSLQYMQEQKRKTEEDKKLRRQQIQQSLKPGIGFNRMQARRFKEQADELAKSQADTVASTEVSVGVSRPSKLPNPSRQSNHPNRISVR